MDSKPLRLTDSLPPRLPAHLLLAAIVSSSDDAIISEGLDGTITSWNRAAERMFGYAAEEILGKSIFQLVPPELHEQQRELLQRLRHRERIEHFDSRRIRKDGTHVFVSLTLSPIVDEGNTLIGVSKVARDISQERNARNAQAWLGAIIDSSDDAIISKDMNGIITSWNKAAMRIFGYAPEEIVGRTVLTIIPPELQNEEPMILDRLRRGERIEHFQTVRLRKDGTRVRISLTVSPIRDDTGKVVGASKVARDVTPHFAAEHAQRQLAAIVDSSDDAIISKDLNGIVTSWNTAAERLFGYTADEMVGKPITLLMRPAEAKEEPGILARIASGEKIEHYETIRVCKDGQLVQVSLTISALRDASGAVVGASKIARDITNQKRIETELRESRAQLAAYAETLEQRIAERTARLQETIGELEAFSYSISHDMRTPLRAMQGYSEILLAKFRDKLNEDGASYLERIQKNAQRLQLLVTDVLAYSRIAKTDIELTPIDLEKFIDGLMPSMPDLQGDVDFLVRRPLPMVYGHEAYLSQIFSNLVGNAVKFAAEGRRPRIEISAHSESGIATVEISDNGIGIAPEHFERIFEIFGQVYSGKKFDGTGIGLSIVRKAIQRMGGQITVQSQLGKGSTFSFTLRTA